MTKSTTIKILKIAGIIIGVVLIVVLAILFYLDRNAGSIAENQLKEAFAKSPLSQVYELNYKAIDIGLFSGNVKISDLTLTPNPMIYTADDTLKSRYLTLLDLVIDKVIVKGFDTESGLSIKNIELASIVIRRPEVKVIEYLSKEEKNRLKRLFPKQPKEPDSVVKSPGVQGVKIGKFIVENGKFDLYDYASNTSTLTAGKFSLSADSLRIHTTDILQTILGKTFNRFYVSCKELKYPLKNGFYTVELGSFKLYLESNTVELDDFELIPQNTKAEFGKKFGKQTDRMDLKVKTITIEDLNLDRLITDQGIDIRLIKVEGLYLDDYRDKNDPFDFDNFPKLPQQSIGAIKNYLNIRKIEVKNSQIVYEELAENAENAGKVHISKVYGSLYNITNDRKAISKSGRMKWDLQGMLFNQGELKLEVDFPADLTSGNFTFQGRIGPMEMTAFNEMTEPNAYIRIDQGALDSMIFTTQAGEDYSEGELLMVYQDLKLKILKKEEESKNDVQGFISSLANAVIRSFNPHKKKHGSPADTASIFFVRDKNKSIFNYMVKSLLSGIKGSVVPALSQTKEKYEKKKLKEEQSDIRKERRQERKDKREEKKKGF